MLNFRLATKIKRSKLRLGLKSKSSKLKNKVVYFKILELSKWGSEPLSRSFSPHLQQLPFNVIGKHFITKITVPRKAGWEG